MPKITDISIQKNNKNRANLSIDGEFAFGLELLTVMKLGLKIGQEVTEERLREAVLDSEKSVALEKAMNYIGRCRRTAHQMQEYLQKKGYEPQIVEYVLKKMQYYGYVDDEAYAAAYAEQSLASKGARRIKQELISKGIAADVAEGQVKQDADEALQNAERLAERFMRGKPCDIKTLQRLQRYLLYRGYDFDCVNKVVRKYKSDDYDD